MDSIESSKNKKKETFPEEFPFTIGPYRIETLYRKGGMSLLFLGFDEKKKMPVMIKILSPRYQEKKEVVLRFLKEAEIIAFTHHPNIVQLYGYGKFEKGLYIAMEFVQGISLKQFIQKHTFSLTKALEIVLQVAQAICHLHAYGVIHRDLKPENILIEENGEIKVIDFGIAQLFEEEPSLARAGTPTYMSPEQKNIPPKASFASDIYSLGIIAYELVTGQLSQGKIFIDLVPIRLREILKKTLAPDPLLRYQDIVDFIQALKEYLKNPEEEQTFHDFVELLKVPYRKLAEEAAISSQRWNIQKGLEPGLSLYGLYFDFLKKNERSSLLFFSESFSEGFSTLCHHYELKGTLQATLHQEKELKKFLPQNFLFDLNQTLTQKKSRETFYYSYLLFLEDKDQLYFGTEESFCFYLLPHGTKKWVRLSTPNPLLGKDPQASFSEASIPFHHNDRLFLFSKKMIFPFEKILKEKKDWLEKEQNYPMEHLIFNLLKVAPVALEKDCMQRTSAIYAIERTL